MDVKKFWDGYQTAEDESVTVRLMVKDGASGTEIDRVTLNKENDWKASLENLPLEIDGKPLEEVAYLEEEGDDYIFSSGDITKTDTVVSEELVEGKLQKTNKYFYQVKASNEPVPEKAEKKIKVSKVWDGMDAPEDKTITIDLKQGLGDQATVLASLELNKANGWKGSFDNLPAEIDGQPIENLVYLEERESDQYTVSISDIAKVDTEEEFRMVEGKKIKVSTDIYEVSVTNKPIPDEPDEPNTPPDTSDGPNTPPSTPDKPGQPGQPPISKEPPVTTSPGQPAGPKTGDEGSLAGWIALAALSLAGGAYTYKRRQETKADKQ